MTRFPINYITLEGPDLSGKTTLYSALHKATSYAWNIHDRSCLSMLIHAKQYERDCFFHTENFKSEILNMNNKLVILLPEFEVIRDRYNQRGDDIQSLKDIKLLHAEFMNYAETLERLPNVLIVRDTTQHIVKQIVEAFSSTETASLDEISKMVFDYASASIGYEATPLTFTIYDDGNFLESDPSVMNYDLEKEYYNRILSTITKTIQDELEGKNPYKRLESVYSRRFIYTDNTCISLIHASYRENILDVHFVLRSSEVAATFKHDLKFLYYLTSFVFSSLGLNNSKDSVRMRFNLNSAHILS